MTQQFKVQEKMAEDGTDAARKVFEELKKQMDMKKLEKCPWTKKGRKDRVKCDAQSAIWAEVFLFLCLVCLCRDHDSGDFFFGRLESTLM